MDILFPLHLQCLPTLVFSPHLKVLSSSHEVSGPGYRAGAEGGARWGFQRQSEGAARTCWLVCLAGYMEGGIGVKRE